MEVLLNKLLHSKFFGTVVLLAIVSSIILLILNYYSLDNTCQRKANKLVHEQIEKNKIQDKNIIKQLTQERVAECLSGSSY